MFSKPRRAIRIFKILTGTLLVVSLLLAILIFTGIIWRSPGYYKVSGIQSFEVPIMNMNTYDSFANHRRPYIYQVSTANKGSVYVLGIEHTKDSKNHQIDSIQRIWQSYQPTVALVEGRLGFLFSWFQHPVSMHGESGATVYLSKKYNIPFYTWEPERQNEVDIMLQKFSPEKVALFYSLRPYFSNFRFGKPSNPDEQLKEYIQTRTDYKGIRGIVTSVAQVDSIWKKEYPQLKDWRDTSDEYGWPEGWFSEMANYSNITRDIHMCSVIHELVAKGENVFITMGSSHAFRIEQTLRQHLKRIQ